MFGNLVLPLPALRLAAFGREKEQQQPARALSVNPHDLTRNKSMSLDSS